MIHLRQKLLFWRTVKNPTKMGVNLSFFIFSVHVVSFTFTVGSIYYFVMVSFYHPWPNTVYVYQEESRLPLLSHRNDS
jgi:hypothetical protein